MAVEMVTEHLKTKLQQHPLVRQYPNLDCMEASPILKQLHTIIRDKRTGRADFVFFADRLIRLVVEAGLGYLPFGERCVPLRARMTFCVWPPFSFRCSFVCLCPPFLSRLPVLFVAVAFSGGCRADWVVSEWCFGFAGASRRQMGTSTWALTLRGASAE